MLIGVFLAALLAVVLGAVWSAFNDLKARDAAPPQAPVPMTATEEAWPPPPRRDGE